VPRPLRPALPWSELVLGGALVAGFAPPWTALVTIGLLLTFSGAVAVHVARRDAVPCGCFGDLSARPVGAADLVRNASLIALAVVAAEPARPVAVAAAGAAAFGAGAWLALEVVSSPRRRRAAPPSPLHPPPPPAGNASGRG
jgi:hypothetical protein